MYQVSDTIFGYGHNVLGGYIYLLSTLIVENIQRQTEKHTQTDRLQLLIFITYESIMFAHLMVIK